MSIEEEEEKFLEELANRSQVLLSNLDGREVTKIQDQIDEAIENRQEVVQSYCLRSKKYLDLGSCNIDDFDSLTIGIYLNELHSNIEVINLAANQLTDEGLLNMLIGMQFHSNLRELYLGNNQFQNGTAIEGLSTIIPCLKNLQILGLGGLNIDDEDLVKILYGLSEIESLKNLQLHKNLITDEGLVCIISMMLLGFGNQLETLYLGQNDQITEDGIVKLFECLSQNQTLKCLHLNDIIMTDKSLQAINISLMTNQNLEELNLGNCAIDDEGFKLLHDSLKNNTKLQYLHLWNNYLTYESAQVIEEILENYNSVLKGITLYNNDIINKELLQSIDSLIQQNVYFERTVNNEEYIEKQIQEMKKSYTKQKKEQAEKEKEAILLKGKFSGQKNIPLPPQNLTKSISNKSNLSQNSTQLSSSSTTKLSISSTPTKTVTKRPQSGTSATKPLANQTSQVSNASRTTNTSKPQIASTQNSQKNGLSSSKIENKSSTVTKSKLPPKTTNKETSNKQAQQKTSLKKNVNQQNNLDQYDQDSDDLEYISLSESINGSIIKREVGGDKDIENLENVQNIQKQKVNEDSNKSNHKQKSQSLSLKHNQQQQEDVEFEEEWLDDDEEDEKELQMLEKQLEQDEEIIAKEKNTRLEFIDEFYNEEESNKEFKKYDKYNQNILQYDPKDPNTLKWQGFFEDKSTGLLKSKYQ